ncbi:MAG: DUF748 domain-containing protein [Cytophagaceae bacterium]|nr:DUF748 domain-containing protein [Cytophagaceae bacterium]
MLKSQTGSNRQKAENINIHLENIKIDTISPRKVLYTDHVHFSLKNYQLLTEDSLYLFSIQRMEGSYSDSLLKIDSIRFIPIKSKSVKNDTYSLFIKQIKTEIIDFPLFFKEQKISIGKIEMDNPKLSIKYTYIKNNSSFQKQNLIKTALPYIGNSFSIKTFSITNGEINSTLSFSGELIRQKASNIYLDLNEVKIDSSNFNHGHYWKDLNLKLSDYEGSLHSKNLKINIQRLETPSGKDLNLTSVKISELHPAGKNQQLIFENSIKNISLNNIDFHRLSRHQELVVDNIQVNNMHLHVFRDQTIPPKQSYAARMPNELVRELPIYLKISRLSFNNAHITYSDHSPELKEDAKLTFERMQMEVSNFTNDPRLMTRKNPAKVKIRTYVMGQGLLSVNLSIPLLDKQFNCNLDGTLGKMDALYFNSLVAYGGMQLKEGNIEAQRFNISVADGIANGEMQLIYENLHVNVIEKKSGKPKKILSKIANLFLKDDNKQKKNKGPETVAINYTRQSDDGFFSFIWNSLSDAILETIVKEFFQPFVKGK